jgi:hypothetical protein
MDRNIDLNLYLSKNNSGYFHSNMYILEGTHFMEAHAIKKPKLIMIDLGQIGRNLLLELGNHHAN